MPIPPGATQVAGKILTSCWKIYSAWKEKADKSQQTELEKIIADLKAGKTLGRQIGESLSRSLQSLRLSTNTLETLRLLDADALFHGNAAECLQAGILSSEELTRLIRETSLGAACPPHELETVAMLWLDAIELTIGGNESLSHALQFKSSRRLESAVSVIAENSQKIIADSREIRQEQESVKNVGLENLAISRDMFESIRRLEEKLSAPPQQSQAQNFLQKHLQTEFEKCRDHLLFGSVDLAEKEFRELIAKIKEIGEIGISDLLFRSHLNHSSCLLLQNRTTDAKEALEQARKILPDDNRYLRHYASLLSYEGIHTEALEIVQRLRISEPEEPKNVADEFSLLRALKRNDELTNLVDSMDVEDADVQCHKAYALQYLGRHEQAVVAARKAVQINPHSEGPWVALAYTIGFPVVNRCQNGENAQLCPMGDDAAKLSDAIEAALKAEEILQNRSRKSLLEEIRGNLLAFYILLNRKDEGVALAMKMVVSDTTSEITLGNLYHTFLLGGKFDKALEISNQMVANLDTVEARITNAGALASAGHGELALEKLNELKSTNEDIASNLMWIIFASKAYHSLHQADQAIDILKHGIQEHPESAELQLAAARLMAEMRKDDQALEHFHRAEMLCPNNPEILSYFGQFLYFNEDWVGALEKFEKIGARSPMNPLFPRMVATLFNCGKFDDCLDCVRNWRSEKSVVEETVFGVGCRAAIALDEWPLAVELLEILVRTAGPNYFENLELLAKVYLRLDESQKAYTLLSRAVKETGKDVKALTLLAQVCAACGKHSEALQRHLQSINANPASIPARAAFFGTMLALPEGFEAPCDILRLHHENIPILTSDSSRVLRAITVQREDGEYDFSNLQQELEKNAKAVSEVLEYSRQNPMPLRILASDLGAKMYEGWSAFTCDVERGVYMCSGTMEEQKSQILAVNLRKSVSVDLIALFTLHGLGKLDLLTKMFDQVFVHISILDDVVQELRDTLTWPSSGKLGWVNGQMIMIPPQPDEREQRIQALKDIRSFIKSNKVILSGLLSTTKFANFLTDIESNSRIDDLMKSALVAHERKALFLSDDYIQRYLASRLTCPAFCTQALLRSALAKKLISQSEYQDAVLRLHSLNYHFVSDNKETLFRLIERGFTPTSVLAQKVLTNLVRHSIYSEGSRRILVIFLFRLWINTLGKVVSTISWMPTVWGIIEKAGTRLNLVFRIISDLPAYSRMTPKVFSRFISFVCDSRRGDRRKACKLLNHAVNVATACSKTSDLRFRRAWKKEAKNLRKALRIQNML